VNSPLKILCLEDDPKDAELIQATLEAGGVECSVARVENESEFSAALEVGDFELILADYTLPSFDGISALKIAKKVRPELPFIFVSGTLDEEVAIESLKIGATDYVFKTRLSRTVPSVRRALRETEEKKVRRRAEEALQRSEQRLRDVIETIPTMAWTATPDGANDFVNQRWQEYTGISLEDTSGDGWKAAIHPSDLSLHVEKWRASLASGEPFDDEARLRRASDGKYRWFLLRAVPLRGEHRQIVKWYGTGADIEDRKCVESRLQESEQRFRAIFDEAGTGIALCDLFSGVIESNRALQTMLSRSSEELSRIETYDVLTSPDRREADAALYREICTGARDVLRQVKHHILEDGRSVWANVIFTLLRDPEGRPRHVLATHEDITDRKRAEDELQKALEEIKVLRDQLYKENIALREEVDKASMFEEIIGDSPALRSVLTRVSRVAPTDATVLITGETGTGKELIARAIHKRSQRSSRAFVTVNCAAIPTSLIASELFGHEKGAFTGALQRRLGRFELADGGTIFLDEVGELPLETQTTLLRILQEREFERVGGNVSIGANVRVIAATNRDLDDAIISGTFRRDLFYRLNVVPVEIPPLRERKEDILMLTEYFIDRYGRKVGKKIRGVERETLELLQSYPWPGNIRELQNVIERSVVIGDTEILSVDPSWLSPASRVFQREGSIPTSGRRSADEERKMIEAALAQARGRVSGTSGAAAQLGMPASTLESKIRTLNIDKYRFKRA
jgi:formate hydrogenlyase transcriptional activator